MYHAGEDIFYYLTVQNENYPMPPMPDGCRDGILKGMYKCRPTALPDRPLRAQLLGSGSILNEVIKAQQILAEQFDVAADVWSVTSYKELRRDALDAERYTLLHPGEEPRTPYVTRCLQDEPGVIVAASDYMKALPDLVGQWMPRRLISLGTDGYGRSSSRAALRDFFEVDARFVALAALSGLAREGVLKPGAIKKAMKVLDINPEKPNPVMS